jgi:Tol biopolymer transport system component
MSLSLGNPIGLYSDPDLLVEGVAAGDPNDADSVRSLGETASTVAAFRPSYFVDRRVTERASVNASGQEGNGQSRDVAVSADGRYVVFSSLASNLDVAGPSDTNGKRDVFRRDRVTGATMLISLTQGGALGNGDSSTPDVSADGRYVVFASDATNLVTGDTNGTRDVFLRDALLGTTTRLSVSSTGAQANGASDLPSIAGGGGFVAFQSTASNLTAVGDTNGVEDIFVRDLSAGTTTVVSVNASGSVVAGASQQPDLSYDGRHVVFQSAAVLEAGDANGLIDVYARDRVAGRTVLLSKILGTFGSGLIYGNGSSAEPCISDDGRLVAFTTLATIFDADTNGVADVVFLDRDFDADGIFDEFTGGTFRFTTVSKTAFVQGNDTSDQPAISGDGRCIAWRSAATNLVPDDANGVRDVFRRYIPAAVTERISLASGGAEVTGASAVPRLSQDGLEVAFQSSAADLVAGDGNGVMDVFTRELDVPDGGVTLTSASVTTGQLLSSNPKLELAVGDGAYLVARSAYDPATQKARTVFTGSFVSTLKVPLALRVMYEARINSLVPGTVILALRNLSTGAWDVVATDATASGFVVHFGDALTPSNYVDSSTGAFDVRVTHEKSGAPGTQFDMTANWLGAWVQ